MGMVQVSALYSLMFSNMQSGGRVSAPLESRNCGRERVL
jgi:hypothetical protein